MVWILKKQGKGTFLKVNPLNAELNTICHLLALLAHHIFHVSRIRVNAVTVSDVPFKVVKLEHQISAGQN
jgi:hypothetical protein